MVTRTRNMKKPAATVILMRCRLILDVHEEQDDDDRLEAGDGQRDDGVEDAEVDVGGHDGERRARKQRGEDHGVLGRRDDVVLGVLRVGDVGGIVEVLFGLGLWAIVFSFRGC